MTAPTETTSPPPPLTRDGRLLIAYRMVSRLYFHLPVLFVFWYVNELPLWSIALALGAYAVTTMFGARLGQVNALRYGEKPVLVVAELLKALSLLILVLSPTVGGALIGEVVAGLGFCLSAGPDTILMRRIMAEDFDRLQAKTQSYMFLALLVAGALGGLLFSWDERLPFAAGIAAAIVASLVIAAVRAEPVAAKPASAGAGDAAPDAGISRPTYVWIAFYALERGVLLGMFVGLMPYYFYEELDLGVGLFGVVLGCFTLAGFFSARYGVALAKRLTPAALILGTATVTGAGMVLFASTHTTAVSFVAMVLLGSATGLVRPVTQFQLSAANLSTPSMRTALSRMERAFGFVNAVVVVGATMLLDVVELQAITVVISVVLLVTLGVALFVGRSPAASPTATSGAEAG